MEIVEVTVRGSLYASHKALLEAGGGNYSQGGCGDLIWIAGQSLLPGQTVHVELAAECGEGDQGKTLAELFPGDEPYTDNDPVCGGETTEIAQPAMLHEQLSIAAETSQGQQAQATSDESNTHYAFAVLWDSFCSKARVSLQTHCLDDEIELSPGTTHLKAWLAFGESATFTLCA